MGMLGSGFAMPQSWLIWVAVLWSLPWKGWALWKAAKRGDTWWFVALFLVNTVGLLDMIYLFVVSERRGLPPVRKAPPPPGNAA